MKLNEKRFRAEVKSCSLRFDGLDVIEVSDLYEIIAEMQCRADHCNNEARYDSGYCGIHDIEFNNSEGNRWQPTEGRNS